MCVTDMAETDKAYNIAYLSYLERLLCDGKGFELGYDVHHDSHIDDLQNRRNTDEKTKKKIATW